MCECVRLCYVGLYSPHGAFGVYAQAKSSAKAGEGGKNVAKEFGKGMRKQMPVSEACDVLNIPKRGGTYKDAYEHYQVFVAVALCRVSLVCVFMVVVIFLSTRTYTHACDDTTRVALVQAKRPGHRRFLLLAGTKRLCLCVHVLFHMRP